MLLSKICSAAAMAHFLRIKTNIARELDAHLFPIIEDLKAGGSSLEMARREVFFLKVCAGRSGILASRHSHGIQQKVLTHYNKSMRNAFASGFPGRGEDFDETLSEFETRYQTAGNRSSTVQVGPVFETALCGSNRSKYASNLAISLFDMKREVIRKYLDSKWIY